MMNRTSRITLSCLFLFGAGSIYASEAYTPIAYGVKSLGMGGISVATLQGADSGFENPALLSYLNKNEVSIGATYSKPSRKLENSVTPVAYHEDSLYMPYLALNYRVNDNFKFGVMASKFNMQSDILAGLSTDIQKSRLTIPFSYRLNNFSFGASFVAEKEKYLIADPSTATDQKFQDGNYGYILGVAYRFPKTAILVAVNYKSKIIHKFFNVNHYFHLNSASELGVGVHWKIFNTNSSIGVDYKRIYSSKIYESDTNPAGSSYYDDQNVYAIGYSYDTKKWSARVGYRYVSSLYRENLLSVGYPYMSKSHYTVGGTYHFSDRLSADMAVVYAPYKETLRDSSIITSDDTYVSVGFNYTF